jgi:hypothetical protein
MRPRFVISVLIIVLAIFFIIFWCRPVKRATAPEPSQGNIQSDFPKVAANIPNPNAPNAPQPTTLLTSQRTEITRDEKMARIVQDFNDSHNHSIEFYGQVIDQDSNALPNVKINIFIPQQQIAFPTDSGDFPTSNNLVHLEKETEMDGRFDITSQNGNGVDIESIQKNGYEVEPIRRSYGTAVGSFNNPMIFKMWSTNIHEQLVSGDRKFQIVPDGNPYFIDLTKGEITQTEGGDLKVRVKRPEQVTYGQRYDWECEIDVVDGGLCQSDSYSMLLAPSDGYQQAFHFEQKVGSGWGDSTGEKRFYVMLHNGKEYGRISIELYAYYNDQVPGMIRLSYALNPSGSQILR